MLKKVVRWLGYSVAVLAGVMLVVIVLLATVSDWNGARPWINTSVSAIIDRPFAINGDLSLHWVRREEGFSWRLPRPKISAVDIVIGNPDWAKGQSLAQIRQLTAVLDPFWLTRRAVVLPILAIEGAQVSLERLENRRNNWTFREEGSKRSRWRVAPGALSIRESTLQLRDAHRQLSVQVLAVNDEQGFTWSARGTLNDAPLKASGTAGSLLVLKDTTTPYPITFRLAMGDTRAEGKGTLSNPARLAALDMTLNIAGTSMAQLYPLTGLVLPETSPYATQGNLVGILGDYGRQWRYEGFSGTVGGSDLRGTLAYQSRKERPLLTANLVSDNLSFDDLGPLIGADSRQSKLRRNAPGAQPEGKVLPVEPFKTERLASIDVQASFKARKITRQGNIPIDNLNVEISLQEGVLTLAPLNFGVAGGDLVAEITLDSRQQPPRAEMSITPRRLKLRELFPAVEHSRASLGEVNGSAVLSARGNSIAELLGSSSGEIKLFVDRGTVSKFILEAAGLNLANLVISKLFGDREVILNCAAADMDVSDGLITTRGFIIDTDDALINVEGDINMGSEELDLTLKPQSRGLRVLSLRSPLHVNGTFKNPDLGVDKGALALRGGAAIAMGILAWPAAILPLISAGKGELPEDNGCVELLAQAKEEAVSRR